MSTSMSSTLSSSRQQFNYFTGKFIMMETEEDVDRISSLPDDILIHILSFLPTKEAVAASILSKRWENIWTNVPVLNFYLSPVKAFSNFKSFVDSVLIRNNEPVLRLFKLHLGQLQLVKHSHVWSWITNVLKRDVYEIDILCLKSPRRKRPFEWRFVSDKLKVLKLRHFPIDCHLLSSLPNLLTLHLTDCVVKDDKAVNYIWSCLPCLNEFRLNNCGGLQNLRICSSSLKRLMISYRLFGMKGRVIIETPRLEYINFHGEVSNCKFYINIPSLVEAHIITGGTIDGLRAAGFLKHFHNVKTLNITASITLASMVVPHLQPLFPELTCLDIDCRCHMLKSANINLFFQLCEHAPNLVSLKYKIASMDESPALTNQVPKCFSTLKAVDVYYFRGMCTDNAVIEYILRHATVLQVIRIHIEKDLTMSADAIIARLSKIPKASSACQIVICYLKTRLW